MRTLISEKRTAHYLLFKQLYKLSKIKKTLSANFIQILNQGKFCGYCCSALKYFLHRLHLHDFCIFDIINLFLHSGHSISAIPINWYIPARNKALAVNNSNIPAIVKTPLKNDHIPIIIPAAHKTEPAIGCLSSTLSFVNSFPDIHSLIIIFFFFTSNFNSHSFKHIRKKNRDSSGQSILFSPS